MDLAVLRHIGSVFENKHDIAFLARKRTPLLPQPNSDDASWQSIAY